MRTATHPSPIDREAQLVGKAPSGCLDDLLAFFNRLPKGYPGIVQQDTPLLTSDILDSLLIQDLLAYIEDQFGVALPAEEVRPETFATPGDIADLVDRFGATSHGRQSSGTLEALNTLAESQGLTRHWLPLGSGRHHFLATDGAGPSLVFLAGLGSPASSWSGLQRSLQGRRRSFALDLAGFGISDAVVGSRLDLSRHVEDTLDVLKRAVPPPWVLVGHSAGAMIAAELVRRAPAHCLGLVTVNFGPIQDSRRWWDELRRLADDPTRFWTKAFHYPPPFTDALQEQLRRTFASQAYLDFLDDAALDALPHALDGIYLPTLLIGGQEDGIIPPACVAAGAVAVPGARLAWLARCGHFGHAEHPQEVLVYLEDFLKSLDNNLPKIQ